jgi:glycosyltransferase involved in cell wall biosynthesis
MFELLVIDDSSTDSTRAVIETIVDKRVRYYNFGKIGDIARIRNIGIDYSIGEYIAFCDDDDIWDRNKLEEQIKYIDKFDFICTNARIVNQKGKIIQEVFYDITNLEVVVLRLPDLLKLNCIITSSVLLSRTYASQKFKEDNSTISAEDYELWLRLANNHSVLFINKPLVMFRKHCRNSSSFGDIEKDFSLKLNVNKILKKYLKNQNDTVVFEAQNALLKNLSKLLKYSVVSLKIRYIFIFAIEILINLLRRNLHFGIINNFTRNFNRGLKSKT